MHKKLHVDMCNAFTKFSDLDEIKSSKTRKCILLLFEACCVQKPPFLQLANVQARETSSQKPG